jgi:hypothetical protein
LNLPSPSFSFIPSPPHFWNSFNGSHFYIYIHGYTIFAPYSPSYSLFPHPPPPTGTNLPGRTFSVLLFPDFVEEEEGEGEKEGEGEGKEEKEEKETDILLFKDSYTGSFFMTFPYIYIYIYIYNLMNWFISYIFLDEKKKRGTSYCKKPFSYYD